MRASNLGYWLLGINSFSKTWLIRTDSDGNEIASRDFASIKNDLVEYAKKYYPDTFKDFNEASFGSLMLDTVAYVGDILSYYLDHQG